LHGEYGLVQETAQQRTEDLQQLASGFS
jgi:hypothetical protein